MAVETIKSYTELSKSIQNLREEYRIPEFEKGVLGIMQEFNINLPKFDFRYFNPSDFLKAKNTKDFDVFLGRLKKYSSGFTTKIYNKKAAAKEAVFYSTRKNYLYPQFLIRTQPISNLMDSTKLESLFSVWLEMRVTELPPYCFLTYELSCGNRDSIYVRNRPPIMTEEFIDCRPIDHAIGKTRYDKQQLTYVYEANLQEWIPIPLKMIVSIEKV